jgi:uncharacterized protein YndB with AHSA1/START domain
MIARAYRLGRTGRNVAKQGRSLEPVVCEVPVRCAADDAFEVFTEATGAWWPPGFSAAGDDLAGVVVEGRVGGRVYEVAGNGSRHDWGTVTAWEPGRRLELAWTLGVRTPSDPPTRVAVDFADAGPDAGRVRLAHAGWQPGQESDRERFAADGGWSVVLDAYRTYADIA